MRKSTGVGIAVLGVSAALASGLSAAPTGAWRGELIMAAAVLCMAFYNVWSRPFMQKVERARVLDSRHGIWRGGTHCGRVTYRSCHRARQLWPVAMDCGYLFRCWRWSTCIHSVGARSATCDADPRGSHDDRHSYCGRIGRCSTRRRADYDQPGNRSDRGLCGNLGRYLRDGKGLSLGLRAGMEMTMM